MSQTVFQKFEEPLDRLQLIEDFIKSRLGEIGAVFGNAYIEGLRLVWVSGTSITVKTGAADVADGSRRLRVTADIPVTSISLGNNAWGHVYLYNNSGVPAVEVVTTAPAHYFGSAYQKSGASSRRYLGSVKTGATGNIFKFTHFLNDIFYLEDVSASPFRCLPAGSQTVETDVAVGGVVPPTAQIAQITAINTSTNANLLIGNPDDVTAVGLFAVPPAQRNAVMHPLTSNQTLNYKFDVAPSGGAGYVDVRGYRFER